MVCAHCEHIFGQNPSQPAAFGARKLHFDQNHVYVHFELVMYTYVIPRLKAHLEEWSDIYPLTPKGIKGFFVRLHCGWGAQFLPRNELPGALTRNEFFCSK